MEFTDILISAILADGGCFMEQIFSWKGENDGADDEVIKELDMNRPAKADPIRTRLTGLFTFFHQEEIAADGYL
jgi:hypothetical protein